MNRIGGRPDSDETEQIAIVLIQLMQFRFLLSGMQCRGSHRLEAEVRRVLISGCVRPAAPRKRRRGQFTLLGHSRQQLLGLYRVAVWR